MKKKVLALIMAITVSVTTIFAGAPTQAAAAESGNSAPEAPTNLKIELLDGDNANGIGTKTPSFSWAVNDSDKNEVQSAYRIVVSETLESAEKGEYIYDSQWISSAESAFAKAEGLEAVLKDNELYYWQVQTADKEGLQGPLSEPSAFTTAMGGEWTSTEGIWYGTSQNEEDIYKKNGWTDYVVEQEVTTSTAVGLVFRAQDSKNCYFWQVKASDNTLNPHKIANGAAAQIQSIKLSDKGITLPKDKAFKVKIQAKGNVITTWIDTGSGYKEADQRDMSNVGYLYGPIGYRTGNTESAVIDNVMVTKADDSGTKLCELNFESGKNYFSGTTMSGGKLSVGNATLNRMSGLYNESSGNKLGNFVFFRSNKIQVDKSKVEKAVLSAAATNTESSLEQIFDLYVNEQSIGTGPARDYKSNGVTNTYYNSYDVTDELLDGENVISALAHNRDESGRAFLAQLTLFYKDGTSEVITNSAKSGWKVLDGTAAFGDTGRTLGTGYFKMEAEDMNMTFYPEDWKKLDFDDSNWSAPVVKGEIATGSRVLVPYASENTTRHITDEVTKSITKMADGSYLIDLGKEIVGGMKVSINSPKEQQITVCAGEQLNSDGSVRYNLAAGPQYKYTWTLKEGQQDFETATMLNYRYVQIFGYEGELTKDSIKGWAMYQDFDETDSSFDSSDEFVNTLYEWAKYSISVTNQDLFTDSQARERRAYEGDLLVNSSSSYAISDNYSLARHSNEYLVDNNTWPADYLLFSVEMAYKDYLYTGNTDSVTEYYDRLKKKIETAGVWNESMGLIQKNNSLDSRGNNGLIDWPTNERDGYVEGEFPTPLNAEYCGIYGYMAEIAEELGKTEEAQLYKTRSAAIKKNMIEKLYDSVDGKFYDSLDASGNPNKHSALHSSAYALAYGVYSNTSMMKKLTQFVGNGGEFKGSIYMTYFILRSLYNGGNGDAAMKLLTNPDTTAGAKTFASVINTLGSTISPEAWSNTHKSNMTMSHPWGASPGCQIAEGMMGVQPTEAGFKSFDIKLQPGGVEQAQIKVPSVKGSILASFEKGGTNEMSASVTIPANTKAWVYLPVSDKTRSTLLVDGEEAVTQRDGNFLKTELGSGTYTVSVSDKVEEYKPEIQLSAYVEEGNVIEMGKSGTIQILALDQFGEELDFTQAGSQIEYSTSDEDIASVSAEGVITPVRPGEAVITVKVTYMGQIENKELAVTIKGVAADQIKDYEIRLDQDDIGKVLECKDISYASLMAVYGDASEQKLSNVTFASSNPEVAAIDENGKITAKTAGETTITSVTKDGLGALHENFDSTRFTSTPVYNFEGNMAFGNLNMVDSVLTVGKGKNTFFAQGSDWENTVIKGTFVINENAATISFGENGGQYYFWQFRADNLTLKKHISTDVYDPEIISLTNLNAEGENDFMIACQDGMIYTYLNGKLVDITAEKTGFPLKGRIGVRTGYTEEFTLKNLSVSKDLAVKTERLVTVIEQTETDEDAVVSTAIRFATPDNYLREGDTATASLTGTKKNGEEVTLKDVTYSVKAGSAVSVEGDQVTGLVLDQTAVLKAETKDGIDTLAADYDIRNLTYDTLLSDSFESVKNPLLPGLAISEGRVKADKNNVVINTSHAEELSGLEDYVVSGTFTIEENAATIAFAAPDAKNFYFWQFRSDSNILRRHTNINGTAAAYGTDVTLKNLRGPGQTNKFMIAIFNQKIYTYLNGMLVDAYDISDKLPTSGSVGVRAGKSESFYLNDLKVGEDFRLSTEREVTVKSSGRPDVVSAQTFEDIQVDYQTPFEEIGLPETVILNLDKEGTAEVGVTWGGDYDLDTPGTYTLFGVLDLKGAYSNSREIRASIQVTVNKSVSAKPIVNAPDVQAVFGTNAQDAAAVLADSILAQQADGTRKYLAVTWSAPADFDGTIPGDYIFSGKVSEDERGAAGGYVLEAKLTILENGIQAPVQTAELQQILDHCRKMSLEGYTKESAAVFEDALVKAEEALAEAKSSEAVKAASGQLKAAVNQLQSMVCGHTQTREEIKLKATCTQDGMKYILCKDCQKVIKTETIKALGNHVFGEWTTVKEADIDEEGIREHTCENCYNTYQESIEKLVSYLVTFMDDNGTVIGESKTAKGDTAAEPEVLVRRGYEFTGWNQSVEKVEKDMTVIARYSPVVYSITYKGVDNVSAYPKQYTIEDTIVLGELKKDGYTFDGWYLLNARIGQISKGMTGNLEITARWTKNVTKSMKSVTISGISDMTDTGSAITVNPTVKDGTKVLVQGRDYTVTYVDNVKPGTARVLITGAGDYQGSITKTFQIKARKGKTYTVGSYKYKVTAYSSKTKTVTLMKPVKTTYTSVKAADTIKIGKDSFKVTAINARAFENNKKLTRVTIGVNVKTIGAYAFRGATKLKSITITGKNLKSIGKQAFKNIHSKAVIKVPSSKKNTYKKLLKNKGQKSSVVIK